LLKLKHNSDISTNTKMNKKSKIKDAAKLQHLKLLSKVELKETSPVEKIVLIEKIAQDVIAKPKENVCFILKKDATYPDSDTLTRPWKQYDYIACNYHNCRSVQRRGTIVTKKRLIFKIQDQ